MESCIHVLMRIVITLKKIHERAGDEGMWRNFNVDMFNSLSVKGNR